MSSDSDFLDEVRRWFADHVPRGWRELASTWDAETYEQFERDWLTELNQRGFGAPGLPTVWGGGGYSPRQQAAIYQASAEFDTPPLAMFDVSRNHVPATFLAAGTVEQQKRYIRSAIEGTVWCQGFSEPGAGSDLAALTTRANAHGTGWRLNGQKVWSSYANHARFCLLLARTGEGTTRREGITYFVLDMSSPGVTVRPIRQNPGTNEFCEIFLDDAFVTEDAVIGDVGRGWQVAQATLSSERGPMALDTIVRTGIGLRRLLHRVAGARSAYSADQDRLARLLARQVAIESLALDSAEGMERGVANSDQSSVIKVAFSELLQDVGDEAVLLTAPDSLYQSVSPHFLGYVSGNWSIDWLSSWAATISGGTNEIQRDIIAEKVLGMPRSSAKAKEPVR